MLTYEKDLQFIIVTEIGYHEFDNEEEKDRFIKNLKEDGFEEEKDFIIFQKVMKNA